MNLSKFERFYVAPPTFVRLRIGQRQQDRPLTGESPQPFGFTWKRQRVARRNSLKQRRRRLLLGMAERGGRRARKNPNNTVLPAPRRPRRDADAMVARRDYCAARNPALKLQAGTPKL